MKSAVAVVTVGLVLACSQTPSTASQSAGTPASASQSATATPSPTAQSTPLSPFPCNAGPSYGLLITNSVLEMIGTCGGVAASTRVAPPSVVTCTPAGPLATLKPPVSASDDLVYYRDGDTKIRSLTRGGQTADVTTVPGGPNVASAFAVSPDDQRIAVAVEDFSSPDIIQLRLYVEDLHGGANHTVLYNKNTPNSRSGITLWPMGWHEGRLVFSILPACTDDPMNVSPSEWHIVDVSTGVWVSSLGGQVCRMSRWPSSQGVVCIDTDPTSPDYPSYTGYAWDGGVHAIGPVKLNDNASGFSPDGLNYGVFVASTAAASTRIQIYQTTDVISGHAACLWIDGTTLLAPDAVIDLQQQTSLTAPLVSNVATISPAGVCAGVYPGGL